MLVAKISRKRIQKKLRPIFSSVQIASIQTLAFSMPKIRPGQADACPQLVQHYTPDSVKLELQLTIMRRESEARDNRAEVYARKMIFRWLEAEFESVEVSSSTVLS